MNRLIRMVATIGAAGLLWPMPAFAYQNQVTPFYLHLTASAVGLVIALVLLFEALALRKVAYGGAIADKLYFVVLAIVCFAASALAKWTGNFVGGITLEQTEFVAELLVVLGMALLAGYFYSVRMAMQGYLKVLESEQTTGSSVENSEV